MRLGIRTSRFLLGTIGTTGLASLATAIVKGELHFRGSATIASDNQGKFWVLIAVLSIPFLLFMLMAITGFGFERPPSASSNESDPTL